jgi:nickel/cobalt transporter (NicO) family protein
MLRCIEEKMADKTNMTIRDHILYFYILLAICFGIVRQAEAHPHIFVDYQLEFQFDETGLNGIRCEWKHDAISSSDMFSNFDLNGDKELSDDEALEMVTQLKKDWYDTYYYTVLQINSDYSDITEVKDLGARMENRRVVTWFTIPTQIEASEENQTVRIVQTDNNYYIAFSLAEEKPYAIKGGENYATQIELKDSYDAMADGAKDVVLTFRKKSAEEKTETPTTNTLANDTPTTPSTAPQTPSPRPSGLSWVAAKQKALQGKMETLLSEDNADDSRIATILLLCLISFAYGVLHAAGPGHGKVITASWLAGGSQRLASGVILGSLLAFFHGLSGVTVVLIGRFIFEKTALATMGSAEKPLQVISFSLIAALGLFLIIKEIYSYVKGPREEKSTTKHDKHHIKFGHEAEEALEEAVEKNGSFKSILWLALAAGIVPCPGVVLVMLFCSAMGETLLGLLLAVCVTLGMAMTISLAGLIVIIARNAAVRSARFSPRTIQKAEILMRVAGGCLIFIAGSFLLSVALAG